MTGQQTTHVGENDQIRFISYELQNQFTIKFHNTRPIDKLFTISAINIVSHLLTPLNSATLNQFAVNSDNQYLYYHILF